LNHRELYHQHSSISHTHARWSVGRS
jgi:hypothetical protein